MPSLEETYADGAHKANSIAECLNRCLSAPVPSAARTERISALRKSQAALLQRLQAQYSEALPTVSDEVNELNRELNAAQEMISSYQVHHEVTVRSQDTVERQIARLRAQQAPPDGTPNAVGALEKLLAEQAELQERLPKVVEHLQVARARRADLTARRDEAQRLFAKQQEERRQQPAPPELVETVRQIGQLLDEVGAFEKEVRTGAGEAISRVIKMSLDAQAAAFRDAETFHRAWAQWMLVAIAVAVLLSGAIIWLAFLNPSSHAAHMVPQSTPSTIQAVESVVLLGAGRLALLAFLAWAIRYCANLQSIHAEQAVIYRDRLAALGIAESILSATPDVDQKSATLRTLAEGYLNFEQSAFRVRRPSRERRTLRSELRQLKNVSDAIKPIIDSVGNIAEKLIKRT